MKFLKKTILCAIIAVMALAALPFTSVSAAGQNDTSIPPRNPASGERLERLWAWQLRIYDRLGHTDESINRVQMLIDRAKANGKDVSAVQSALDAFKTTARDAHPIYESMKVIINSHQGFDDKGKVIDPAKARETVKSMATKFQELKTTMSGTGRALHEAIKAFRAANPPPQPAGTPSGA